MVEFVWLGIVILLMGAGVFMVAWPDLAIRLDPEYLENSTPEVARRSVRVGGVVLFLLALACLISMLQSDGSPIDAVGF